MVPHPVNKSLHVLVTTDLMARGLDFKGVRNALYDVPKTSIDLIHRVGRTARMKQGGRVFMLTDSKTKSWAKALPKIYQKAPEIIMINLYSCKYYNIYTKGSQSDTIYRSRALRIALFL